VTTGFLLAAATSAVVQVAATIEGTVEQRHADAPLMASAAISADGRIVAFESLARLVSTDTNPYSDIYVLDLQSGEIEMVSVGADGEALNGSSSTPSISGDGRHVVFESVTPASQPACTTLFLRDRQARTTRALATARAQPSRLVCAKRPSISQDGAWVAFESSADDLVSGVDANGRQTDVYVLNLAVGEITRVSLRSDGAQPTDGSSFSASLSATGYVVAFTSTACLDDTAGAMPSSGAARRPCSPRVYVRDLIAGSTRGIRAPGGALPNGPSHSPALSANGRYLTFVATATNLVRGDTSDSPDVYVYDRQADSLELVSRTRRGRAGDGSSMRPTISETGRFVAFDSGASDLLCGRSCGPHQRDHNLVADVFVFDRELRSMRRLSLGPTSRHWWEPSVGPAMDASSDVVAFSSRHPTGAADVRADFDLFILRGNRPRDLHATATLLPDATVFFAGENREALVRPDDPSFSLMTSYAPAKSPAATPTRALRRHRSSPNLRELRAGLRPIALTSVRWGTRLVPGPAPGLGQGPAGGLCERPGVSERSVFTAPRWFPESCPCRR
jgi:Tol biopolymer transport system component